jgi:hypothetical protein
MESKFTKLTHKIAKQLHVVAESSTICSSRSRRPVRRLLDIPSHDSICIHILWKILLCIGKLRGEMKFWGSVFRRDENEPSLVHTRRYLICTSRTVGTRWATMTLIPHLIAYTGVTSLLCIQFALEERFYCHCTERSAEYRLVSLLSASWETRQDVALVQNVTRYRYHYSRVSLFYELTAANTVCSECNRS